MRRRLAEYEALEAQLDAIVIAGADAGLDVDDVVQLQSSGLADDGSAAAGPRAGGGELTGSDEPQDCAVRQSSPEQEAKSEGPAEDDYEDEGFEESLAADASKPQASPGPGTRTSASAPAMEPSTMETLGW